MARVEWDKGNPRKLVVTLSERNLLALLTKLHTEGSACAFENGDVPDDIDLVRVQAELDDVHYASSSRDGAPAGPMHPLTELAIAAVRVSSEYVSL